MVESAGAQDGRGDRVDLNPISREYPRDGLDCLHASAKTSKMRTSKGKTVVFRGRNPIRGSGGSFKEGKWERRKPYLNLQDPPPQRNMV